MFWLSLLSRNLQDNKSVMSLSLNLRSSNKVVNFFFWLSQWPVNPFVGFFNVKFLLQNFVFKCCICFRVIHITVITSLLFQPDTYALQEFFK